MKKQGDHDDKIVGHVLGTGTWRDWLPKWPRPIFAFGNYELYSVLLHGQDFILPIGGSEDPAIGSIQQDSYLLRTITKLKGPPLNTFFKNGIIEAILINVEKNLILLQREYLY